MNMRDIIPAALREEMMTRYIQITPEEALKPFSTQRLNKQGATVDVTIISTELANDSGKKYAISSTEHVADK